MKLRPFQIKWLLWLIKYTFKWLDWSLLLHYLFCFLKLIRLWRKKNKTRWNTTRLVGPPDRIWRLLSPKRHWRAPSYICSRPLESACWAPVQSSPQSWLFSIAASVSFPPFLSLLLYYLALLFLFNHTSGCRRRWRWDCLALESEVSQAF